ncbi:MAG: ATP-binding protein [Clostridiales bacterium]|nr:ATP-binding protein [Clostridiales bacterium]
MLTESLVIYRALMDDSVLSKFQKLLKCSAGCHNAVRMPDCFLGAYTDFYSEFLGRAAAKPISLVAASSPDLKRYLTDRLLSCESAFSAYHASTAAASNSGTWLDQAAGADLDALQCISSISSVMIKELVFEAIENSVAGGALSRDSADIQKSVVEALPTWNTDASALDNTPMLFPSEGQWSQAIPRLAEFHRINGSGLFASGSAFTWRRSTGGDGSIEPVKNPDPVRFSDLIAYEDERAELIQNTEQFLKGFPANNVLLYGDRGTGKSSSVKALLNEYSSMGLRMIEVPKNLLSDFPAITSRLAGMNNKFIVFVDDLAFEDNEENYTALKAALEGGLESKPSNVLIYATSNRRHLIREYFSERSGLQFGTGEDEVRAYDTIQEKLSLADRFGLTIVFSSPDKDRYIKIVEELAARKGISIDHEELVREAMKWELWYNGRSPRTAQQFTNWLKGLG